MDSKQMQELLGSKFEIVAGDGQLALDALGLGPEAAVLDIGTGKGLFAIFLALKGFWVLTGEPADDASAYARQPWYQLAARAGVADRIRFRPFDATALPFEADGFDAIFFFGVLHHIDEAVRKTVIKEALRVAGPDGAVVFFEPNQAFLDDLWQTDPGHPVSADPSLYVKAGAVREQRLTGKAMDIHIFRPANS